MSGVPVPAVPSLLDHVVIAGPDLAALVAGFADRTGIVAESGGVHPTGTANAFVAFTVAGVRGPRYLELIGPDFARVDRALPTRFGIADVAAAARARGEDPGPVADLSRRAPVGALLACRLTHPRGARPDVPFLIDWGSTSNPETTIGPAVELLAFTQTAVDPAPTEAARAALDLPPGALAALVVDLRDGYALRVRAADGTPADR